MSVFVRLQTGIKTVSVVGCCMTLLACEAVPTEPDVIQKALPGKLTAGIRPVEQTLVSNQSVEVVFYLDNSTDESVSVLPWGTPLETHMSADLFTVTKNGDEQLRYAGRVVKRAAPGAQDYQTLAVGERLENIVTVSQGYDMRDSGDYLISLESLNLRDANGAVEVVVVDSSVAVSRQ